MNKNLISILVASISPLLMFSQSIKTNNCSKVKQGTFYFYPVKGQSVFTIIRENGIQKEINIKTGDTTFWKIRWRSACEFNLKFIRKSRFVSNEEKLFYNSHLSVVRILNVSKDYYIFNAGLDSLNVKNVLTDTLWFKARTN